MSATGQPQKVGILTSGGDCAGLNAVIHGIAKGGHSAGIEPYLITNGYIGLYNLLDAEDLLQLTPERVDRLSLTRAGSEGGNSRLKIDKIDNPDKYQRILSGLKKFNIDCLLIAGGDDTGSVVVDLNNQGIRSIHIPKTMDLDLQTYSVGGDSAINRIASFACDSITTARTHNRIMILEIFGRYAGHTALYGGLAAGADIILLPEIKVNLEIVYQKTKDVFIKRFSDSDNQSSYALIIVAEGMRDNSGAEIVDKNQPLDSFGHPKLVGAGNYIATAIKDSLRQDPQIKEFMKSHHQYVEGLHTLPEVRELVPSHLVRCGKSYAYDIHFGLQVGLGAIELVRRKIFGVTIASFKNGVLCYLDCQRAIQQNSVTNKDIAMYEQLGICFGREPQNLNKIELHELSTDVSRIY